MEREVRPRSPGHLQNRRNWVTGQHGAKVVRGLGVNLGQSRGRVTNSHGWPMSAGGIGGWIGRDRASRVAYKLGVVAREVGDRRRL